MFVTDRTQLEDQLSETSQSIGFSVKVADSIKALKELLATDSSDLVMAMIHKFREADLTETFPELNASPNILVMTDEAHRSQYSMLGANLDKGNSELGPHRLHRDADRQDRAGLRRLHRQIHDAPVHRGRRDPGNRLRRPHPQRGGGRHTGNGHRISGCFQRLQPSRSAWTILGYGSRDAYLEAEPTIEAKAKDMVEHYLTHVFPNGYKAQIVATSREAAVRYKKHVDAALAESLAKLKKANPEKLDLACLEKLKTDVIISGNHNDELHLKPYTRQL